LEHYTHKTRNEQSSNSPYGFIFANLMKLKRGIFRQVVVKTALMKMNWVAIMTATHIQH